MNDRKYLLSITELLEGTPEQSVEQLAELACRELDRERLQKVQRITSVRKRAESIGAGLLLQLGLQEYRRAGESAKTVESENRESESCILAPAESNNVRCLTVSQILAKLKDPLAAEYTYSEKGKPYFKNIPLYFNLSHSGEYVFCVFAEQEVGADIQYRKPGNHERIVRRFFSTTEQEAWKDCASSAERERLFYKLWTRKEAYGKLTGAGVADSMSVNVMADASQTTVQNMSVENERTAQKERAAQEKSRGVCWEEYEIAENYQIAVCKYAGEKE